MLAIRLARVGRKGQALYRIVVSDKRRDMYGDHLEIVGNYNPHSKVAVLKVERIKHWLSLGAVVSDTLHNLLVKEGVLTGKKVRAVSLTKKRRAKMTAQENAKKEAEAKAAPAEAKEEVAPVEAAA